MTRKTGKEYFNGRVEMFIKESIKMMKERAMEKCTGSMAQPTKENGKEEFSMGWVGCSFLMGPLRKDNLKIMYSLVVKLVR